jgi:hypothetical protein
MAEFQHRDRTPESYWRAVILVGQKRRLLQVRPGESPQSITEGRAKDRVGRFAVESADYPQRIIDTRSSGRHQRKRRASALSRIGIFRSFGASLPPTKRSKYV